MDSVRMRKKVTSEFLDKPAFEVCGPPSPIRVPKTRFIEPKSTKIDYGKELKIHLNLTSRLKQLSHLKMYWDHNFY